MIQPSKRALLKFTSLSVVAAATALVGCSKKEEAPAPVAAAHRPRSLSARKAVSTARGEISNPASPGSKARARHP